MKRFFFCIILAAGMVSSLPAQTSKILGEKERFDRGVEAFRAGHFLDARSLFTSLAKDYPDGHLATAVLLMLSKSYFKTDNPAKSIASADALIRHFPFSRYRDEAVMVKAQAEYGLEDYSACIQDLMYLREQAQDRLCARAADSLLRVISQKSMSLRELTQVASALPESEFKSELTLRYFERLIENKRYRLSEQAITAFLNSRSQNSKPARDLLKLIRGKEEGPVKVGLVVPLNGTNSEIGKALQSGVELSVSLYNKSNKPKIELAVYDDQSDIISSIMSARELSDDDRTSVIIGPMESDNMAAASVIANENRIPILSPTATKSGLASIGPYVYQANVDIETRSETIARYAVKNLGLKKFAILSPSDAYGEITSNTFAKTVEKLGGEIIAYEKFYDNTQDFKSQLTRIRKLGFIDWAAHGLKFIQSAKFTTRQIDSLYAVYFPPDSTGQEEYAVAMDHLDGLFLPIYTDDIRYIAPQMAFYNIKTQLLGGDNWYDLTELRLHQNYIKDVIFVSESYMDGNAQATKTFYDQYRKFYGKDPAREAVYGFDLMEMIVHIIKKGFYSREEIQAELAKGLEWNGIHNKIIFSQTSRVNRSAQLLQFTNGVITKQTE